MSWSAIMGKTESTKLNFAGYQPASDTIFSGLTEKVSAKKIEMHLKNERTIRTIDSISSYNKAVYSLVNAFGEYMIKNPDGSITIRGNLDFIALNQKSDYFGEGLDLFNIMHPFSEKLPIFIYTPHRKILVVGIHGEVTVKKIIINHKKKRIEAFTEEFIPIDIEAQIPLTIQDVTDFDELFTREFGMQTNLTSIKIGASKEITPLQEMWFPIVSGSAINGDISGMNGFSLVSFLDSGSKMKEHLDYFINYMNPDSNAGKFSFNKVEHDVRRVNQIVELLDIKNRNIFQTKYRKGFRASVGTVIQDRKRKNQEIKRCVGAMVKSSNTDYTQILDGFTMPVAFKNKLKSKKDISSAFKYYLQALRVMPVKYKIKDITEVPSHELRMASAFAKLSPYLLDVNNDEIMVPERIRDLHMRATSLFKKQNSIEVQDYMKEQKLIE